MALPLLFAAIPGLVDMGVGLYQGYKGDQLSKTPFTPYKTSDPFMQYVSNAQVAMNQSRMPGQSRAEELINAGASNAIKATQESAQDSSSILANISAINANSNNAYADLGVKAANFQQSMFNQGQKALLDLAQQKDKEYDINVYKPYMANMAAASALKEASIKNTTKGIDNLSILGVLASGGTPTKMAQPSDIDYSAPPDNMQSSYNTPANALVLSNPANSQLGLTGTQSMIDNGYSVDQINEAIAKQMAARFASFPNSNQQNQQMPTPQSVAINNLANQMKAEGYTDDQINEYLNNELASPSPQFYLNPKP